MSVSAVSFLLMALMLPVTWWCGSRVGKMQDRWRRGSLVALVFGMLLFWAWLLRNPAIAVNLLPIEALARLEGIGAAPLFTFVMGVAWSMGELRRQRALVLAAGFVGAGYFLQGGAWMLQSTPQSAFAGPSDSIAQIQSQDYSCVPASCSTTLRLFGIDTNESEMARLTETRPGTGATMLRAMNGLSRKLQGSSIRPILVQPDYEKLLGVQPPFMVPLRFEARQLHMVTVLAVLDDKVIIADPAAGIEIFSRHEFELFYHGQAIIFERLDGSPVQPVVNLKSDIQKHGDTIRPAVHGS